MVKDILSVTDLQVWFPVRRGFIEGLTSKEQRFVKAVDGVSFKIRERDIFCLVGESGCGKTTTGKAILRLVEPTGGNVKYGGEGLTAQQVKEAMEKATFNKMFKQQECEGCPSSG